MLFLLAMAMAAPSATETGSDYSVAESRKILADYGACIVKSQQARASEVIVKNADNQLLLDNYRRLIDGDCLPRQRGGALKVQFVGDQYRYALADALVRKELASQAAPLLNLVPRLDHRDPGAPPLQVDKKGKPLTAKKYADILAGYEREKGFSFLSRYGECVVRADPAAAHALLLAEPETADEGARFVAMREALGTCMPEGETLRLGKLALRGSIAINYYRLAKAAQVPMTGAPK